MCPGCLADKTGSLATLVSVHDSYPGVWDLKTIWALLRPAASGKRLRERLVVTKAQTYSSKMLSKATEGEEEEEATAYLEMFAAVLELDWSFGIGRTTMKLIYRLIFSHSQGFRDAVRFNKKRP